MARHQIGEHAETAGQRRLYRDNNDGIQDGDPAKVVAVIISAVDSAEPPLHRPLGPVAYGVAERKLAAFQVDLDAWRADASATNFN